MSQAYFVTGTDTGVGKTVLSTILTAGLNANYWKPIQTGAMEGTDSEFVRKWLGSDRVLPETYVFPDPISPHLAARNAGQEICLEKFLEKFSALPKPVIVEGAGGVLVPLSSQRLTIDLIASLNIPVVLATSTRLGTINHTLLTLEALRARAIPVAGIVTIGQENPDTQASLRRFGNAPMLGHVPVCASFSKNWFHEAFTELQLTQTSEAPCKVI